MNTRTPSPVTLITNKTTRPPLLESVVVPGVPEKEERWIFSTLRAKIIIFVNVIRSNIFRRREWYQDH